MLKTEAPSDKHPELDRYPVDELVDAFIEDQSQALAAVRDASTELARAVDAAAQRLQHGGRLIYVGAGTSGRIGVLDCAELFPTFSWPRSRALALIAGGRDAFFHSVEGAEDSAEQGERELLATGVEEDDVVILVAASGTTPFVLGAQRAACAAKALTIAIVNNPDSALARNADIAITLDTGSELISGSTRLKAGTAQKVALNTLSSAIMVRLNKVYGNLMVDLQPTNDKLFRRAVNLTMLAAKVDEQTAQRALAACGYRVKVAIVSLVCRLDITGAEARLIAAHGSVRGALADEG